MLVNNNSQVGFGKLLDWKGKPIESWSEFGEAFKKLKKNEIDQFVQAAKAEVAVQGASEENLVQGVKYLVGYNTLGKKTENRLLEAFGTKKNSLFDFFDILAKGIKSLSKKRNMIN